MVQKNARFGVLAVLVLVASAWPAWSLDNPASFNFDGVLVDNSDNPIVGPVNVTFQIYDPSGTCLLFEESHSGVNPDSTNGAFSLRVGSGSRASAGVDGGLAWKNIFSNRATLRASATANCSPGYTPAMWDGRKLRVTVGATVLSPDFEITSVPFATVADSVQGYEPADFLSAQGGALNGFLKINGANEIRLADSGGTNYVALKAPTSLAGVTSYTLPVGDGSSGQVLSTNGAGQLGWMTPAGGGITDLMGDVVATGPGNVAATIQPNVVTSAKILDGTIAVADIADGAVTSAKIADATIAGVDIADNAISSAKINSTGVTNNRLLSTDGSAGTTVTYVGCALDEVMKFDVSGKWVCSTVSSLLASAGVGTAAFRDVGTAVGNLVELDGTARIPGALLPTGVLFNGGNSLGAATTVGTNDAYPVYIEAGGTTRMTVENVNGRVGVGTTAPISAMHIHKAGYNDLLLSSDTDSSQILLTGAPGSFYPGVSMAHVGGALQFTKVTNGSSSPYPWIYADGAAGIYKFTAITGTSTELRMSLQRGNGLSAVTSGTPLARVSFDGYNSAGYSNSAAAIQGVAAENFGSTVNGTDMVFLTTAIGANTPAERMRIMNNGNVGIGTGFPSAKFEVWGGAKIGSAGSPVQQITLFSNVACGTAINMLAAGQSGNCVVNVTGVNMTDVVSVNCQPFGGQATTPYISSCNMTANNQIRINVYNTSGGSFTPPTNWNVTVIKF